MDAVTFSTGTGGTLAGVSMFLKNKNPNIKTILADPDVSVELLSSVFWESMYTITIYGHIQM